MYELKVDLSGLKVLIDVTGVPDPASPVGRRFGEAIRQSGSIIQAQAIWNVSDHVVTFEGNVFKVRPRTGALKGSIELGWPYGTPYTARVYVNGTHMAAGSDVPTGQRQRTVPVSKYAAAIEYGHGPIDLKRTMRGKIVPFFAARSQSATGPYAAAGLQPLATGPNSMSFGSRWRPTDREPRSNKLRSYKLQRMVFTQKGKPTSKGGSGTYYIAFRRVGKTGWIIPKKPPRPFMAAAAFQSQRKVAMKINEAIEDVLGGHVP